MSRRSEAVSQEFLKEILEYEPKTGVFKWRVSRRRAKKGDIAGSISYHRRRVISIKSLSYTASRLAFLYMTGAFPMYAFTSVNPCGCFPLIVTHIEFQINICSNALVLFSTISFSKVDAMQARDKMEGTDGY
jgi:hypothetical protein